MTVKEFIRPLPGVSRLSVLRQRIEFRSSAQYWEWSYAHGGTSGHGLYSAPAEAKAGFLNDFVRAHEIKSVIEFGCGDGSRLSLADYLDISRSALKLCQCRPFHRRSDDLTRRHCSAPSIHSLGRGAQSGLAAGAGDAGLGSRS